MRIVFIGGGNMARALIGAWVNLPAHAIHVVEPDAVKREHLVLDYVITASEQVPVLTPEDCVVLAVKPQVMAAVCQGLETQGALVMSIAAGVSILALSHWLRHSRIIRVLPNTPVLVGKGVSGLFAPEGVSLADKTLVTDMMSLTGVVRWCAKESELDDITCISGSGPAYVFYFMESMIEAACQHGFSASEARQLVLETFDGAVKLAQNQPDVAVATLRQNVTSPGGTTAEAIAVFQNRHIQQAIEAGISACRDRAVELGEEWDRTVID